MVCRRKLSLSFVVCAAAALSASACTETPAAGGATKSGVETPKTPASQPSKTAGEPMKKGEGPYFVMPSNAGLVAETFTVAMGINGKKVVPAGTDVPNQGLGHHHVIIDGKPIPKGIPVPADATHKHYGKGQTETVLTLAPGKHTLTLQFADGAHVSYGPEWSKTITVEVKAGGKERGVSFVTPADNAKVKSPVKMKFAVTGMKIVKAGENPTDKTGGHHHVIIDGKPLPAGLTIPANDNNRHFGKGQTEAEIKMAKGKHTLTLQFGDATHASYGATMSKTITVDVE